MKKHHILWTIVFLFAVWFVYVHFVRGVPVRGR